MTWHVEVATPGRYEALGATFFPTWSHGAVTVHSRNGGLIVETFRTGRRVVVRGQNDPPDGWQIFKLPPQDTAADPIRSRARGKFPIGMVVIGFLALLLLGILGYAGYRTFLVKPQPLEPFTNTLGMKMLKIEGGTFRMGSPDDEPGRVV